MKSTKKLIMLILLLMMSLNGFSQIDTISKPILLEKPLAKLVIKDLIRGDGYKNEVTLLESKINILEEKIQLQDSIIFNLDSLNTNYTHIINLKTSQLNLSQDLNSKLTTDLKKQKFKSKLLGGTGILAILGVLIFVK